MTLPPSAIFLMAVITIGYLAAASICTWAYCAYEKE